MKKSFALLSLFVFVVASFSGCFKKKSAHIKSSGNSELASSSSGSSSDSNNLDFDKNISSKTPDGDMVPGFFSDDITASSNEGKSDKKNIRSKPVGKSKTKFTQDSDLSEYEFNSKKSSENQKSIAKSKVVVKNPKTSEATPQSSHPAKNTSKQQATKSDSSQKASGAPKQVEKPAEKKVSADNSGGDLTKEEKESLKKIAAAFNGWENKKANNEASSSQAQPTQQATDGLKTEKAVKNEPVATQSTQITQPAASGSNKVDSSQVQQTKPNKVENGTANDSLKTNVSSPVETVTLPQ